MRDAVAVIAEQLAQWETPFVELDIFGTGDPERIFAAVDAFVRSTLHASIAGYLFQTTSISSVHGVGLDDGREVVVKAKPPAATNPGLPLDRASLEAIVAAQRTLHAAGFPCPQPLIGPIATRRGPRDDRDLSATRRSGATFGARARPRRAHAAAQASPGCIAALRTAA